MNFRYAGIKELITSIKLENFQLKKIESYKIKIKLTASLEKCEITGNGFYRSSDGSESGQPTPSTPHPVVKKKSQ